MASARKKKVEVGMVYARGERLLLGVPGQRLLAVDDRPRLYRLRAEDKPARGVSVGELCDAWQVDLATLDAWVAEHMPVPAPSSRKRGRSRRSAAEREHRSKELRLHRLTG